MNNQIYPSASIESFSPVDPNTAPLFAQGAGYHATSQEIDYDSCTGAVVMVSEGNMFMAAVVLTAVPNPSRYMLPK